MNDTQKIIKKILSVIQNQYLRVFFLNFFIAMVSFIGLILRGNGVFTLCNDFNEQQIPFHMLANSSLKNGGFLWNWSIDLGSSFVGALGFYVLGSPFAWLSFLFPAKMYPYITGWLYMMKYAAAGVFAYCYIKRFTNKKYAAVGSVLYAFSGFQSVNLIFHHFHDAVAFFPLLLIGYEKLSKEGKKGMLVLGVAINAFVNYYFFIQEVIFLILYFLCREGIKLWRNRKLIGRCFIEGILGVGVAGILFIPSVLFTLQNPRLTMFLDADHWFYSGNRDYLQVIRTLLFPGELMCSQSCIKEYDWTSWSVYLPMIGITLVLCYAVKNRKSWLAKMIIICMAATAVPILNSVFGLFSDTNYHRWLYMLILLMSLASAMVMENRKIFPIKTVSLILTVFMICITAGSFWWSANKFNLINQPLVFLIWSSVGIAGVFITFLAAAVKRDRTFFNCMLCGILVFSAITTGLTAELYHKFSDQKAQDYYDQIIAFQEFSLPDDRYRFLSNDNTLLMASSLPGTGSFTSMVNGSIYEFYESLGTSRPVFTPEGPEGTRELIGGRYFISDKLQDGRSWLQKVSCGKRTYYLYENKLSVPIGSAYDMYMTANDFKSLPKEKRALAMLKCIIVPDNSEKEVSSVLRKYNVRQDGKIEASQLKLLVESRCKEASETIVKSYHGFSSIIVTDRKKYAFFSVPYDRGYRAYVNDTQVDILNTNGMMSIPLDKGKNEIRFEYWNYDLLAGIICTIISLFLYRYYIKKENSEAENSDI